MNRVNKGISIAREIILTTTFCLTIANVVLMIIQLAIGSKVANAPLTSTTETSFLSDKLKLIRRNYHIWQRP